MDVPAWLAKWKITSTWEQHIARGSKGGVDYGAPKGTSIIAPTAGTVDYRLLSDGSSVARVKRADGTATEFLHGIPYPNGKGSGPRAVKAGDVIATSDGSKGAWGANGSTGPHIHVHDVDKAGNRQRPFSTITSSSAGGNVSPITEKDEDMTYALCNRIPGPMLPGVPKDAVFIGSGTDPLVWVNNWGPEMIQGVVLADWNHEAIADRIQQVGIRGSGANIDKVYASFQDARDNKPAYVLGKGSVGDVHVAADPALVAAVKENTALLGQVLAATRALNPPG